MEKSPLKELPEAKYTKFGEKMRHVIPGPMQCSMACGGRNCKWENPSRWSDADQVIKGVFSSWVLDDVVAMSRPSTEVIEKYHLIKQFKESNIGSIINLQRPGEHASCGPPLHKESQFTYEPKIFMDNDIFFYNFGWKDYGVASLETILDMVKVMAFALSEGKVAVHCHAGLGRTGVLIACFLVYAHRMDASSAINTVRKRRPNSIQTRGQIACIQEFAQFLKPLRIVFPQVVPHAERLSLEQFLHRQRHLLHGFESRELRYIPKIISVVCQRLVEIATTSQDIVLYDTRCRSNTGPKMKSAKKSRKGTLRRSNTVETLKETIPGAFVNEHLGTDDSSGDPMDSQRMNALLSPRVSRRSESAKSRSNSSSKSLSRPESPVSTNFTGEGSTIQEKLPLNSNNQSNKPILVTSTPPQPFQSDSIGDNVERIPGKPQVVLVKQGSRSGLLSSATNITQSQPDTDGNLNNNNQMVPPASPPFKRNQTFTEGVLPCSKNDTPLKIDLVGTEVMTEEVTPTLPNLPSPTPSIHEPQISPRGKLKSQENDEKNAAGDKPLLQNVRMTSGQQQRVLPTGMPARGRAGSAKGKLALFIADEDGTDGVKTEGEKADITQTNTNTDEVAVRETELNKRTEVIANDVEHNEGAGDSQCEATEPTAVDNAAILSNVSAENSLDQELEEIIEMKDDEGAFLSESESEKEEIHSKTGKIPSATSKVSWSEKKESNGNSEEVELAVGEDLVRRADSVERSQTPTSGGDVHTDEEAAPEDLKTPEGNSERSIDGGENEEKSELDMSDHSDSACRETTPKRKKRPKSAGFLKRLSEKNQNAMKQPQIRSITLTQSLCDLRTRDNLSLDDLAIMKSSEMTSAIFLPLSPSSKSSSSDDVRTPTGSATKRRIKDPITVAMALAYKLTDNEWLWEKVYTKQVEVNTREGAWSSVEQEVDAHLLSCLMWSWVEHLSKPLLTAASIDHIIKESRPNHEKSTAATECPDPKLFENALATLGKPTSSTLRCVLHCLLSLPPLSFELEASVIKRVTSAFTQLNIEESDEKTEQLVSLIQNYLVKTRARNLKKQSSIEGKDSKDNEAIIVAKKTEIIDVTKNSDTKHSNAIKKELSRGEGDSAPSASKVTALRPGIIVS